MTTTDHPPSRPSEQAQSAFDQGLAALKSGSLDRALGLMGGAVEREPRCEPWRVNLGVALCMAKRYREALAHLDAAIELEPRRPETHGNRGVALRNLRRHAEAIESLTKAIELKPTYFEAFNNRALVLKDVGRDQEALADLDRAVDLNRSYADALFNRGALLAGLKKYERAIADYERARVLRPTIPGLSGALLSAKMQICDWRGFEGEMAAMTAAIDKGEEASPPLQVLVLTDEPGLQRRIAETHASAAVAASSRPPSRTARHDRIRLGYFSPDLRDHAIMQLISEMLALHDRERFEVTAFYYGPPHSDAMRRKIGGAFERFLDVRDKSDAEIIEMARRLEIDIAIDLAGYSIGTRSNPISAQRAAPVQVNYIGYPGTMAAGFIDYIIGDPTLIPDAHNSRYSEKIVRLPHCYVPFDTKCEVSGRVFARSDCGLPAEGFVFSCFNAVQKILPDVFASWARILKRVPGSVLWLLEENTIATANLEREAERLGIGGRLVFAPRLPIADHLARHRLADLFLDTVPYNAHTTAMDALWMGLPVLTLPGQMFAARVAASLLKTVGLPELIASSRQEYEDAAVALATDSAWLAGIRRSLDVGRRESPLFDMAQFTRHLEAAFTAMQERHLAGLPPDHIAVPA